jgi:hypothetical protein
MKGRLQLLLSQWIEAQQETNKKLDTIASLLVSHQLLQECVDHAGQPRSADEIAELVADSFSAGRCLVSELDQRNKEFEYQKSEFFIDENDSDGNGPGSGLAQF